jgi:hypothetical protein
MDRFASFRLTFFTSMALPPTRVGDAVGGTERKANLPRVEID